MIGNILFKSAFLPATGTPSRLPGCLKVGPPKLNLPVSDYPYTVHCSSLTMIRIFHGPIAFRWHQLWFLCDLNRFWARWGHGISQAQLCVCVFKYMKWHSKYEIQYVVLDTEYINYLPSKKTNNVLITNIIDSWYKLGWLKHRKNVYPQEILLQFAIFWKNYYSDMHSSEQVL